MLNKSKYFEGKETKVKELLLFDNFAICLLFCFRKTNAIVPFIHLD